MVAKQAARSGSLSTPLLFKSLAVFGDVCLILIWYVKFIIDSVDGARRLTHPTTGALIRVDEKLFGTCISRLVRPRVDADAHREVARASLVDTKQVR